MSGKKYAVILAALTGIVAFWLYQPVPPGYSDPWSYKHFVAVMKITHKVLDIGEYFGVWTRALALRALTERSAPKPTGDDGIKATDAVFDGVKVRRYEPKNKQTNGPGMVYLHGGGWVVGSVAVTDYMVRYMVKELGLVIVSVDYRLAPEHPFPVPLEDCEKAVKYFLKNARSFDVDPSRVVIIGDSAGGNLVASLLLKLRDTKFSPKPKLAVMIYPCVQALDFNLPSYQQFGSDALTADFMVSFWLLYAQGHTGNIDIALANAHTSVDAKQTLLPQFINHDGLPKDFFHSGYVPTSHEFGNATTWAELKTVIMNPYYAPLVTKNLENLAAGEMLVVTAQHDVLRDEGVLFAKRMKRSGNKVTHIHLYYGYHGILYFGPDENPVPQSKLDGFKHVFSFIDSKI